MAAGSLLCAAASAGASEPQRAAKPAAQKVKLSSEERTTLRLHLLDRLSIDDLAPILGVHRATAARRLQRLRQQILEQTRARLQPTCAPPPPRWTAS